VTGRVLRRATTLILRAEADLEEAGVVLADAFLRTDPQEWIVLRDKRAAGLAGVSGSHSGSQSRRPTRS
jgi:hypothetical protein